MKTVIEIESQVASLKARPKTDSVQARIESLERQRAQILSADRKDVRKLRARAIYIIGSTVEQAAEQPDGQHVATWLRDRVRSLPQKDRDVVRGAFPRILSGSSSTPMEAPLPPQAAAHTTKETKNG